MRASFIFLSYCSLIFGDVAGLGGCSTLAPVACGLIGEEIICIAAYLHNWAWFNRTSLVGFVSSEQAADFIVGGWRELAFVAEYWRTYLKLHF